MRFLLRDGQRPLTELGMSTSLAGSGSTAGDSSVGLVGAGFFENRSTPRTNKPNINVLLSFFIMRICYQFTSGSAPIAAGAGGLLLSNCIPGKEPGL